MFSRTQLIAVGTVFAIASLFVFQFFTAIVPDIKSSASFLPAQVIGSVGVLPEQEQAGQPVRLKIPAIEVDSVIENAGLTAEGAMENPKTPAVAAWFGLGVRPGEIGSAVIAGHYGWKNGIPAAFDSLHKLRPGDKIYIEDDRGAVISFVVRESKVYGENDDAGQVFGSTDGKAHLNLITCGGVYDKKAKSYSDRLVVFSDKE